MCHFLHPGVGGLRHIILLISTGEKKICETNVSAVQNWKSQKGVFFFLSDHERNFANGLWIFNEVVGARVSQN